MKKAIVRTFLNQQKTHDNRDTSLDEINFIKLPRVYCL